MLQFCVRIFGLYEKCNVDLRLLAYNSYYRQSNRLVNTSVKCDENNKFTKLVSIISSYFNLDIVTSRSIIDSNQYLIDFNVNNVQKSLETCLNFNIDKTILLNNLWLAKMKPNILQRKLDVVSKMNFNDINHSVPFLSLSPNILGKIHNQILNDSTLYSYNNRLYYLSEKIKIDPSILAEHLAKRHFIYNIPLDRFQEALDILLYYKVHPDNIIKDLWVLRYLPKKVKARLDTFSKSGKEKMMPWMVKCPENTLERSIDITLTTKKVLGENNSSMNYLASRLNCSYDTVQEMSKKLHCLSTIRVSKLKNILDFLFSVGFIEKEIISAPKIFPHSLDTIKKKYSILKALNVENININFLCLCNKDFYTKFKKKKIK